MPKAPQVSPGTVSKILWHFTGGPKWDANAARQHTTPKPAPSAYKHLKSILKDRELRLGSYKEVVKATILVRQKSKHAGREEARPKKVPVRLESTPVCCISDIPAPHLRYHAYRYGKFAIGFHRNAVIRAGFNPVLYTLEDTPIVRSIYRGLSRLKVANVSEIESAVDSITFEVENHAAENPADLDVSNDLWTIGVATDLIERTLSTVATSVETLLGFVKSFDKTEFSTIYCEREWRATNNFRFDVDDIAMVVLPRITNGVNYYRSFVERTAPRLRLPRRIPVVAWDDLIEH